MNTCALCGKTVYDDPLSNPTDDHGSPLCDNCFFDTFAVCDVCGGVTPDRDMQIFGCRHCNAKGKGVYLNGETGKLEIMMSENTTYIMENHGTFENDKEAQTAMDKFGIEVHGTYWPSYA